MKHIKTQKQLNEAQENLNISDVIKRLSNDKEIELKGLDRFGFVPDEVPNYKEWMSNDDAAKVKGYMEGYKQALQDILNVL
jgi:hypothetical protein